MAGLEKLLEEKNSELKRLAQVEQEFNEIKGK